MERRMDQIAKLFKELEDEELIAKCKYQEVDARYREMADARERAYKEWQDALRAFDLIDALQGMINEEAETSENEEAETSE